MDPQNNWHKFNKFFANAPALKRGIFALAHQDRIIHGAISDSVVPGARAFRDKGMPIADVASAFDALTDRYRAKSLTVVDRDELLRILLEMPLVKGESGERLYHAQLAWVRTALGIDGRKKSAALAVQGERPLAQFFPRFHFLLQAFRGRFADLLPERRIIFVGVCDESNLGFESLLLEYNGRRIARVIDPDYGNFDWRALVAGFVKRDGAARFVNWVETKYMLPAYAIFLTRATWEECEKLHAAEGTRAAWRCFLKKMRGGDLKQEALVEPYAWPVRAAVYWNAFRG